MNKIFITALLVCGLLSSTFTSAQKFAQIDDNPTDITYFKKGKTPKPLVKVSLWKAFKETG